MEISLDGTGVRSSNILDLKNPFFRYTGVQTQPPPGNNTQSPTETYWNSASVVLNGGIMNTSTAYAGQPSHGSGSCGFATIGWNMKSFRFFLEFDVFFSFVFCSRLCICWFDWVFSFSSSARRGRISHRKDFSHCCFNVCRFSYISFHVDNGLVACK